MPAQLHEVFERQLATFEALRRIGFEADELFVYYNGGEPITVIVVDGVKVGVPIRIPYADDEESYCIGWQAASLWWNTEPSANRHEIFQKHWSENGIWSLIVSLHERGLPIREAAARIVIGLEPITRGMN